MAADAARRLETWEHNLAAANLKELNDCWRNRQRWRDVTLNDFDDRQTNGYAEGVTYKSRVMKRRSYGFTTATAESYSPAAARPPG